MRSFFTTLLLMIISAFCFGQSSGSYDFVGFLTTSDGQLISFKLMINEIKDGTFKGYSVTNYEGKDYTKSLIEGKLDLVEKKISFKEISNTETKSTAVDSTFCYITASNLTFEISDKKNIIKGKFQGLFPSGKTCATGAILLINKDVLVNIGKENELKYKDDTTSKKIVVKDMTVSDSVLTSNEVLFVDGWKNGLAIEVWDGDVQDNDEIAIYFNGKLKRAKIVLMQQKTIIELPSNENNFKLKIVALNEGRSGKNTLRFRLKNASTDRAYVSELKKGESFEIDFKRK